MICRQVACKCLIWVWLPALEEDRDDKAGGKQERRQQDANLSAQRGIGAGLRGNDSGGEDCMTAPLPPRVKIKAARSSISACVSGPPLVLSQAGMSVPGIFKQYINRRNWLVYGVIIPITHSS